MKSAHIKVLTALLLALVVVSCASSPEIRCIVSDGTVCLDKETGGQRDKCLQEVTSACVPGVSVLF